MTPAVLKSEDGFTLAEAVMSLLVVSLSLAALLATASLCVRTNRAVAAGKLEARAIAEERARLLTALSTVEPVTDGTVVGSDRTLAAVRPGGATVLYTARPGFHLRYIGDTGIGDHWPEAPAAQTAGETRAVPARLGAVILTGKDGAPMATLRLDADLSQACRLDPATGVCHEGGA
jgi:type II secretory pathway pseudopilin PulG